MKYSAILLAVAASVTAQFSDQTAQTIADGLAGISAAVSALDTDVQAYSGAADSEQLIASSEAVVASIQSASSNLQDQPQMPITALNDALGLIDPTSALGDQVSGTIDNVIAKKQAFVDACQGPTVLAQLNDQKTAAVELIELVVVKTPPNTETIVRPTAQPLLDALDRGIAEFSDQTSLPESCSASSAAPTVSPTSAAPSSAASSGASVAPSSVPSGVVTLPTGSATPVPSAGQPSGSPVPSQSCLTTTTTVTVTAPSTPVPTHPGAPSGQPPVVTGHSTFVPGKPTPTPVTPPQFTGAAVANGVTFGGFAAAGLAMLAVF